MYDTCFLGNNNILEDRLQKQKMGEDQGRGPRKTNKEMGNIHIRGKRNQMSQNCSKTIMWI
jgi:hypothetical protein